MPTEESHPSSPTIFPESRLAHEVLDGLEGLEIGPAAHNPFGLRTRNVGLTADHDPVDYAFYRQVQLEKCGSFAVIDIAGDAANIPLADHSTDFVCFILTSGSTCRMFSALSTSGSESSDRAGIFLPSSRSEMRHRQIGRGR